MKQFCNIHEPSRVMVSMEERSSQKDVLRHSLKIAIEVAEWTGSGRLFQGVGVSERNSLAPALALTLGTDRVIPLFDLSEWDGSAVTK